jgi:hypothetical protein
MYEYRYGSLAAAIPYIQQQISNLRKPWRALSDFGFKVLMEKCVQYAVDIFKDVNTIPRQNDDIRSIALTMFIQRARA